MQTTNYSTFRAIKDSFLPKRLRIIGRALIDRASVAVLRAEGRLYDAIHGVDTGGRIPTDELDVGAGTAYQGVSVRHFRAAMRAIPFPDRSCFIDFGSGKGRSLLLAAEYGEIADLIGVEMSPMLCAVAERNLAMHPELSFKILNQDAMAYRFSGIENLIFFYNPFGASVLKAVMDNLIASVASHPRDVWVIYCNPVHGDVVQAAGFDLCTKVPTWTTGRETFIYHLPAQNN